MKMLLINTCGGAADMVALAETARIPPLVAQQSLPGRSSSEQILPALRIVLSEAGWTVADLDAIVVVSGPGSFTGVRVGLSVAKGLCEATGIPLVALSRLALLAAQTTGPEAVLALLDAGRDEFFAGLYHGQICEQEMLLRREEVAPAAKHRLILLSEPKIAQVLAPLRFALVPEPDALAVFLLARVRIAAGVWTDVASVDANYQRRTDAELLVERQIAGVP